VDQKIGISKAARLLGINRSELNERLAAAGIETFEGEVDYKKVQCIAPTLNFGDPITDRIKHIRQNPAKRIDGHETMASKQDLMDEITKLSSALRVEVQTALQYRNIIEDVADRLGEMQRSSDPEEKEIAFEMCNWLRERIIED
jgi:CDP-4-dehydro-6-deoxyglucose reductase, E3